MNTQQHLSQTRLIRDRLAAMGRGLLLSFIMGMVSLIGPAASAASSTLEVILHFDSATTGSNPGSGLTQGMDGALYGTTVSGGSNGYGTVFKLNPDGSGLAVLHDFDLGAYPAGGLIQGSDGALYGTTQRGGVYGYGTVFKLNPDGSGFSVLQSLNRTTTGAYPAGGLVQGANGQLFGTAYSGGSRSSGTVFRLNSDGSGFSVLIHFNYPTTGGNPLNGLVQGPDRTLYGTTHEGGGSGIGTVFRLNPDGSGFAVLQNFDPATTGFYSQGGLLPGADGALYGTTSSGGGINFGTVFMLNPDGSGFHVLHTFDSDTTGAYPAGGLIQGADGALYGTANGGGSGYGSAFKLNPDGSGFAVLHDFDFSTAGAYPRGSLIQGVDGAFYGTTSDGGGSGYGTVFRLKLKQPPVITSVGGPLAPLVLNSAASIALTFADESLDDTHSIAFSWGDGTFTGPLPATLGLNEASHVYSTPGVYRVDITVTDSAGDTATSSFQYVVIYDPTGGFVTGGGWIQSSVGAYAADPALTGKANFGFVAKYQQGANVPTGNTEFQFKAGELNFKSTSYDWLVVAGAKAKFKGHGTINGVGGYAFQLTATDGQGNGGGGTDRFRIKIWDQSGGGVIYDNQPGDADTADATTALGGGSIVVHKP